MGNDKRDPWPNGPPTEEDNRRKHYSYELIELPFHPQLQKVAEICPDAKPNSEDLDAFKVVTFKEVPLTKPLTKEQLEELQENLVLIKDPGEEPEDARFKNMVEGLMIPIEHQNKVVQLPFAAPAEADALDESLPIRYESISSIAQEASLDTLEEVAVQRIQAEAQSSSDSGSMNRPVVERSAQVFRFIEYHPLEVPDELDLSGEDEENISHIHALVETIEEFELDVVMLNIILERGGILGSYEAYLMKRSERDSYLNDLPEPYKSQESENFAKVYYALYGAMATVEPDELFELLRVDPVIQMIDVELVEVFIETRRDRYMRLRRAWQSYVVSINQVKELYLPEEQ